MFRPLPLLATTFPLLLAACASGTVIEVRAGRYDRAETPLRVRVPSVRLPPEPWRLVRADDGREIAAQPVESGVFHWTTFKEEGGILWKEVDLTWILEEPLPADATRRYRLEERPTGEAAREPKPPPAPESPPGVECLVEPGRSYHFLVRGRSALRYNIAAVPPPPGVDPVFARGGYLHPVRTPAGRVVTNDMPPNHLHHHGIWSAWTATTFEGRAPDFWNLGEKKGRVEGVDVWEPWSGAAEGGFAAHHRFVDLTAPGGPKAALDESWRVRVYAIARAHVFDLELAQGCPGPVPLVLKEYRYGGVGFRGAASWEGKDGAQFLTSEGKTRADGHGTRGRWCAIGGAVDGAPAYVAVLCHPSNFRAPQPMRIHPDEPFFNYAPCQAGEFQIVRGKPYEARYRFVASDGPIDAAEIERHWRDFAEPPEAVVR